VKGEALAHEGAVAPKTNKQTNKPPTVNYYVNLATSLINYLTIAFSSGSLSRLRIPSFITILTTETPCSEHITDRQHITDQQS
jgi:hypothetical protein